MAPRYQQGRSLPEAALARWSEAVLAQLPRRPSAVLDLGAGTGIFTSVWQQVGATVIGVEPSPAMIQIGRGTAGQGALCIRSVAETVPLVASSVDVVWVSTAIHHFADLPRAASEMVRVLADDGRILIRTFLPEHTKWAAYELFPVAAQARATARNPTLAHLREVFAAEHFRLVSVREVLERQRSFAKTADWVERMRTSDTTLTAMTDDEIRAAVTALRDRPGDIDRFEISLVTFARSSG